MSGRDTGVARDPVGGEQVLHLVPKLLIDNGLVLPWITVGLVDNPPNIEAIAEHPVERATCKPVAAGNTARLATSGFADNAFGIKRCCKASHRAEFHIPPVDMPDRIGFLCIDDELSVDGVKPKRRIAAHPHDFFFEAAILSRIRSPVTSRSNWAKDSSTLSVSLPMDDVVLNCWVTETKETWCVSKTSTNLAKSMSERVNRSTL